jgi:hypothetical protein
MVSRAIHYFGFVSLLATYARTETVGSYGTHLNRVIEMLSNLAEQTRVDAEAEKVLSSQFETSCKQNADRITASIEKGALQVDKLNASFTKDRADAQDMDTAATSLTKSIPSLRAELANATAIRQKEADDDTKAVREDDTSLAKVEVSIKELKQKLLASQEANTVDPNLASLQVSYLMFQKIAQQLKDHRASLVSAGVKKQLTHERFLTRLKNELSTAQTNLDQRNQLKADLLERATGKKSDLEVAKASLASAKKALESLRQECMDKAAESEKKQAELGEELQALYKAKDALQAEVVRNTNNALITGREGLSLAQRFRGSAGEQDVRQRLISILQSSTSRSRRMQFLVRHAKSGPLESFRKLLQDILVKLQSEVLDLTSKQAYCEKEMSTNKQTRTVKGTQVENLRLKVQRNEAATAKLRKEVQELRSATVKIATQREVAGKLRAKEKARNTKQVKEAQEAQGAVQQAIDVLSNFYDQRVSLLQQTGDLEAAMSQDHSSLQRGSGRAASVISLLQAVLFDFLKLQTATADAEDQAQRDFQQFMTETKQEIAAKEAEVGYKEDEKAKLASETATASKDLILVQKEYKAALNYFQDLKAQCIDTSSKEKADRDAQIASIQSAITALGG